MIKFKGLYVYVSTLKRYDIHRTDKGYESEHFSFNIDQIFFRLSTININDTLVNKYYNLILPHYVQLCKQLHNTNDPLWSCDGDCVHVCVCQCI